MKKLSLITAILLSSVTFLLAQDGMKLSRKNIEKTLVGEWQVISVKSGVIEIIENQISISNVKQKTEEIGLWQTIPLKQNSTSTNFSEDGYTWRFTNEGEMIVNCKIIGKFNDKYKVRNYPFVKPLIFVDEKLDEHGFECNDLAVDFISEDGNSISLSDYNNSITFNLKRTK